MHPLRGSMKDIFKKLKLTSRITLNTIDLSATTPIEAFTMPTGPYIIQAIGRSVHESEAFGITNIYTQNGDFYYLIQIWENAGSEVECVVLLQNVLTLNPGAQCEWDEAYAETGLKTIELDGVIYNRSEVSDKERVPLTKYSEELTDAKSKRQITNEYITYNRDTSDVKILNKKEQFMVNFEIDCTDHTAGISYYVGYRLSPTCLTIAG